jgi:hypothetical protein
MGRTRSKSQAKKGGEKPKEVPKAVQRRDEEEHSDNDSEMSIDAPDQDEAELERLVLGDDGGFLEGLGRDVEMGSEGEEDGEEDSEEKREGDEEEKEVGLEGLDDDAVCFFLLF